MTKLKKTIKSLFKWNYLFIRVLLFHLVGCISTNVIAQSESQVEDILANQVLDESESSNEIADYSEILSNVLKRPLDLNKVSEKELSQIFFLSPFQIQQILLHREKIGSFISPLELQVVPGINLETLEQLLPFVMVKEATLVEQFDLSDMLRKSQGSLMLTYARGIQVPRGYEISDPNKSRYLGSPDKVSNRLRWNYQDRIKLSFNMEKDSGEPFFKEKQVYGFDYYSGALMINKLGPFEKLIIGDYLLQFGQGLSLWNGAVFGKGASVAHIMQQGLGIRPHTGMMESKFMRGGAATFRIKQLEITPFISYNQLTATINTEEGLSYISSINYSGLHRTPSELRNRKSLSQSVYGINLGYQKDRLKIGTNILSTHFSIPLKLNTREYNKYRFFGSNLQNISAFYQYNVYNVLVFGETAHSLGSGWANNHGIIAALGKKFSASLSYRNYFKNYHSFFGQSFQDQSNLSNERGWHSSFTYHPKRRIEWMNSLDYVEFPWLKFRSKEPSYSFQARTQFSYIWYKKGHLRFRYQYKFFQENFSAEAKETEGIAEVARQQARIIFLYKLHPNLQIGNQVEGKQFHKTKLGKKHGFLIFQDIVWRYPNWKLAGNFRISYFNADDYAARLFTYERDVLYSFSFPSYFRKGIRFYFNKKVQPIKGIDVWLRYSITNYFNVEELGTGLDKVSGNRKSDFRFQIRYSW